MACRIHHYQDYQVGMNVEWIELVWLIWNAPASLRMYLTCTPPSFNG